MLYNLCLSDLDVSKAGMRKRSTLVTLLIQRPLSRPFPRPLPRPIPRPLPRPIPRPVTRLIPHPIPLPNLYWAVFRVDPIRFCSLCRSCQSWLLLSETHCIDVYSLHLFVQGSSSPSIRDPGTTHSEAK